MGVNRERATGTNSSSTGDAAYFTLQAFGEKPMSRGLIDNDASYPNVVATDE